MPKSEQQDVLRTLAIMYVCKGLLDVCYMCEQTELEKLILRRSVGKHVKGAHVRTHGLDETWVSITHSSCRIPVCIQFWNQSLRRCCPNATTDVST